MIIGAIAFIVGDNLIEASIPFLIGSYILTSFEGLSIDTSTKSVRKFITTFGIKKGKWIPVKGYKSIGILSNKVSYNMNYRAALSTRFTDNLYKVCLLNKNHTKRFVIYSSTSLSKIRTKLDIIKDLLGVVEEQYNPPKSSYSKKYK